MTDVEEEDPFGVFGDSDDGSSDVESDIKSSAKKSVAIARSLVEAANDKTPIPNSVVKEETCRDRASSPKATDPQARDLSSLSEWENTWPDPLYKGKILLVCPLPVGGGRGYVASESIPPGTLVLVESPMITWPEEQLGKKLSMVSVKHLIKHSNANRFVQDLEDFHPTKEQVDGLYRNENTCIGEQSNEQHEQISKMMNSLYSEYFPSTGDDAAGRHNEHKGQELLDLVAYSKKLGIRSRDGSDLNSIDMLRLLLALRYNGLESGVYRHVAMLNHHDHPNCTKFLPTDENPFSEVRTTRRIQKGEVLTISYLPRILSHASRRKILWEQHRFDIGVKHLKGSMYQMELVGECMPPSTIGGGSENSTLINRIERTTEEFEEIQREIDFAYSTSKEESRQSFETAKALEQSVLELKNVTEEQLQNSTHILMIPILSLHIEICAFLLKDTSLKITNQLGVLSRQILSGYHLLPLQQALLGPDHFDLARTSLDLVESISQLLSRSPQCLYDLKLPSMYSFSDWSTFERETRQLHNRIKALYPHDVGKYILI
eukprot:CAMPEP_0197186496 /NCGR_PEP_ID=MMETSP1423-20130617/14066_1 /TAXON_ID=476441 /ORGANISM="Pseudo-nitzschia heimii, Strain UNC1101" /LENGTH=546 /DNA_ID=CAMNT_0042637837 /DNA_START=49 /DNA_END=1689 /DNA_ORIENTATION=-